MLCLIGIGARLPSSFPEGMDCILTWLWLLTPSSPSDYRSVSETLSCPMHSGRRQ